MEKTKLEIVLAAIENETNVTEAQLRSKGRRGEVVQCRYMFYALASKYLFWSLPQILSFLGKDRTSGYHIKTTHSIFSNTDKRYRFILSRISDKIGIDFPDDIDNNIRMSKLDMQKASIMNKRMLLGIESVNNFICM